MDRFVLPATVVAALALLGAAWATSEPAAPPSTPPPAAAPPGADPDPVPAPDFEIATRSGAPFRLSDHQGEVVVLNFWATWCPPCRREIPDFIELHEELGDEGLTIVGVALDDDWDAVGPFADQLDITYPIAVDDGTVDGLYGPTVSFPTTFVIGRDGNVAHYIPGMILRDDLEPLLRPLLNAPAP